MAHPYPPHDPRLPYAGKHHYFLTFCTDRRRRIFLGNEAVSLVCTQILRAAGETDFDIPAYCFMPDHVHLIAGGRGDTSDAKTFTKLAKQYSGYYFQRENGFRLWQRYGFERVVRDDMELAFTIGYIVSNPVRSGLVAHPAQYPYLGSLRYTVSELLEICEYEKISSA